MTQAFGTGTLSSSDGQRFPVKGKSLTARHLSRYFARGQGLSTDTHVSDQHFDVRHQGHRNKGENLHALCRSLVYAARVRCAVGTTSSRPSRCGA